MRIERVRTEVYEFLALGFRRPKAGNLRVLGNGKTAAAMCAAAGLLPFGDSAWAAHLREFRRELATSGPDSLADDLTREYTRLFLAPDVLRCPPYGSVYLDGGALMGASTVDVIQRYRSEGAKASSAWKEPADHICLEAAFMALLSRRYCAALDADDREAERLVQAQAQFLRKHLLRWAPSFADRLMASASAPLYRCLAAFLPGWLSLDADVLSCATTSVN